MSAISATGSRITHEEDVMSARKVNYCYITVPNRPGRGAEVLAALRKAKVNLVAYSGFPAGDGESQLDLVADQLTPILRVARKQGWTVSAIKKGFLIQGNDRLGAVHKQLRRLAEANVNVTAADAVTAGRGRYGMLLWVKEKDFTRAARALKAR
jgi:hypothetical protein